MQKYFKENNFHDIYIKLLRELHNSPEFINKTYEGLNVSFELTNIEENVIYNEARKFNLDYAKMFFNYIISGKGYDEFYKKELVALNDKAADFLVEFENRNTQYGPRIQEQLPEIIEELKANINSRRASVLILDAEDRKLLAPKISGLTTIEYPCTTALHFNIRNNKLNLTVQMRSQSACAVLVYDVFNFTNLMKYIAITLKRTYPDLELGTLYYNMSSCHYYEREDKLVKAILQEEFFEKITKT